MILILLVHFIEYYFLTIPCRTGSFDRLKWRARLTSFGDVNNPVTKIL